MHSGLYCVMDQTTNAVKAGMVKLIFLAPNTEALDALDEKIDVLITEAQSKDIPICYCLNKRKLVSNDLALFVYSACGMSSFPS